MSAPLQLTRQQVRRLNIYKQHLTGTAPESLMDVVRDIGCLQLDPITRVTRSHLLVMWSRYGDFDEDNLNRLIYNERQLFEYWAHAASIVLTDEYPVHAYRMQNVRQDDKWRAWFEERELMPLIDHILEWLDAHGPSLSRDIDGEDKDPGRKKSVWFGTRFVPRVLQYLWNRGDVMVVGREGKQRCWGLTSEHLPAWVDTHPWDAQQVTDYATQRAVRALGVATPKQIKYHYTRDRYPTLDDTLERLTADGTLQRVTVGDEGKEPLPGEWYMHAEDIPVLTQLLSGGWEPKTTLLSPFDNLICDRERVEQLFDFHFRLEIYTPKDEREYGYYVLPILHGDRLIGRVDPRMDRKTGTLHIQAMYTEPDAPIDVTTAPEVRDAIEQLAGFLGADRIDYETS